MKTYLIIFNTLSKSKPSLIKFIKTHTKWVMLLDDVWMVKSLDSTSDIRNELKLKTDSQDRILVFNVTKTGWASFNVPSSTTSWLKENL